MSEGHIETRDPTATAVAAWIENHRRFLDFLSRRVESRAVAEEILQEAYLRGLEQGGEIRDGERSVAWFYRVLRNAVVDHYRERASRGRGLEALARELGSASEPPPAIAQELCHCFEALLPALRPEYAEILRRVDLEGLRPADFARDAGISANNAMVRLHRARRALRENLERACRTCAEHGCLDCHCGSGKKV